jgi:N-acetylglutamate synthase-like GNAT family acetyltransferase
MNHILRNYRQGDAKGVKDLILSILIKEYPFDKSAYSDSDLDRIGEVYGGRNDAFFVVEEQGAVVGTAGVKEDSPEDALLRRLFVDIQRRRLGYGTELLEKAIAFCREKRYRRVIFRCTDRMTDAMNLCLKKGFIETENLEVGGFRIHKLVLDVRQEGLA